MRQEPLAESMELISASIVIASDGNNPRLLSPDFLANNGIVPGQWKTEDVMVLPPFARVRYENSVEIALEEQRVTFAIGKPGELEWRTELPRLATAFLRTLPHVTYRAAGLNFDVHLLAEDVKDKPRAMVERLLQPGPWLESTGEVVIHSLVLQYRLSDVMLNLTLRVHRAPKEGEADIGRFAFYANFHREFAPQDTDLRLKYLNTAGQRYLDLGELIRKFPFGGTGT